MPSYNWKVVEVVSLTVNTFDVTVDESEAINEPENNTCIPSSNPCAADVVTTPALVALEIVAEWFTLILSTTPVAPEEPPVTTSPVVYETFFATCKWVSITVSIKKCL